MAALASLPLLRRFLFCFVLFVGVRPGFGAERIFLVRYEAVDDLMGCTFGVAAYGPDRDALQRHVESAFAEARGIDGWLSNYRAGSELSRLNRTAADAPVRVSGELFDLLVEATRYSRASEGAFDMTVGPLVRAWGFHDGGGALPDADALARARESVGYRFVELDSIGKTVRFTRPGVEFDPGGIGKGYAVDRMVDVLRRAGVESALVNACHSSVYGLGSPPESPRGWLIEIDSPDGGRGGRPDDHAVEKVFLKDQSLSTSGSREKFFEAGGRVYSHILDPRTGRPAEGVRAVSVVASTALESEVWSTALFVNGLDWASRNTSEKLTVYSCPAGDTCRWIRRKF